ncbi:MAG: hypothetical protein IMZ53_02175 [Thermoplasmata archaeon]|nr:hypothetical protein [Thermoplasmata archaeon]
MAIGTTAAILMGAGAVAGATALSQPKGGGNKQVSTLTGGQNDLLSQLTSQLGGQMGQGVTPYEGSMTAGLSPLQTQGVNSGSQLQSAYQNLLNQYNPQQGQSYLNQAQPALNTMLANYDPAADKEYWNTSFVNPAMQNWNQNIMPDIKEQFASANSADSGMMGRQIAESGRNLSTDLNAQLGNILYSGQQAQLGRQQTGINQAMNMAQMPGNLMQQNASLAGTGMDLATQTANLGGMEQTYNQNLLNEAYSKWQQGQSYNNPWLTQFLGQALGTNATENVYQQPTVPMSGQIAQNMLPFLGAYMSNNTSMNPQIKSDLAGSGWSQNASGQWITR